MSSFVSKLRESSRRRNKSIDSSSGDSRAAVPKPSENNKQGGLHCLYTPGTDLQARGVDIIAVHGLNGDAFRTWTHPTGTLWLRDLLPVDFPQARVFSFGYPSQVAFTRSVAGIQDWARQLLISVKRTSDEVSNSSRQLVFVCHSLGGIIVKKALITAYQEHNYTDLLANTISVVFMGTPHRGSDLANIGQMIAKLVNALGPSTFGRRMRADLLKDLATNSSSLEEITDAFRELAVKFSIITCFETSTHPHLGQLVVIQSSAKLGLPSETLIASRGDHVSICRFSSRNSSDYNDVVGVLKSVIAKTLAESDFERDGRQSLSSTPSFTDSEASFLATLIPVQTDLSRSNLLKRANGTCEWLMHDLRFSQWLDSTRSSILWVTGGPGTGKSILTSYLIDRFETKHSEKKRGALTDEAICYFFCDQAHAKLSNATSITQALLKQVLLRNHSLTRKVKRRFKVHSPESFELTWSTFCDVIQMSKHKQTYIFLDAIDECDEKSRQLLIRNIKIWVSKRNNDTEDSVRPLKVFLTMKSLTQYFSVLQKDDANFQDLVRLEDQKEYDADVNRLISARIAQMIAKGICTASKGERLRQVLCRHANGCMLWVSLTLNYIENASVVTSRDLIEIAHKITPGLRSCYLACLPLVEPGNFDYLKRLLCFLVNALRPLTTTELAELLSVSGLSTTAHSSVKILSVTKMLNDFLGPLIKIDDDVVSFIHPSVKDFFIALGLEKDNPLSATHGVTAVQAELEIAKSCTRYLLMEDFENDFQDLSISESDRSDEFDDVSNEVISHISARADSTTWEDDNSDDCHIFDISGTNLFEEPEDIISAKRVLFKEKFPAYDYAAKNWVRHFQNCRSINELEVIRAAEILLQCCFAQCRNWINHVISENADALPYPAPGKELALLAALGFSDRLEELVKQESKDSIIVEGMFWAIRRTQVQSLKILLDLKGELIPSAHNGQSLLLTSAATGSAVIFEILLERDCSSLNTTGIGGKTALSLAASQGHLSILQLCLQAQPIEVSAVDVRERSALTLASLSGSIACVEALLKDGRLDVNVRDNNGRTALSYAAEEGFEKICQMLLNTKHISKGDTDRRGRNPLIYAVANGHLRVVKTLLRYGFSIAQQDYDGRNAVSWAANSSKATEMDSEGVCVLQFLLLLDPESAAVDDVDGWNPLFWTADPPGYPRNMDLLLKFGEVDLNVKDMANRTVLTWCAAQNYEMMVRILLSQANCEIGTIDCDGKIPLFHAAANGHSIITELLTERSASTINSRDSQGRTAYDWAMLNGHTSTALILREKR